MVTGKVFFWRDNENSNLKDREELLLGRSYPAVIQACTANILKSPPPCLSQMISGSKDTASTSERQKKKTDSTTGV